MAAFEAGRNDLVLATMAAFFFNAAAVLFRIVRKADLFELTAAIV